MDLQQIFLASEVTWNITLWLWELLCSVKQDKQQYLNVNIWKEISGSMNAL